jgi:dTDP-4-dehydrorhamnose 3,5-epimerase
VDFICARSDRAGKGPGVISKTKIDGVLIKALVTHPDERGFFREIIRVTDPFFDHPFGQWSHSFMKEGVVKAWHFHKIQTDYFYVASGSVRVGLYDQRAASATHGQVLDFIIGEGGETVVIKIPPGVFHGVKAVSSSANLLYLMSHIYDPTDEYRIPQDSADIPFDWRLNQAKGSA